MNPLDLIRLSWKQVSRHRIRTLLTLLGVAAGMFLFTLVETMQHAISQATQANSKDTTLIIYRENRFCPATSNLPEHYRPRIKKVPGVTEVLPIQVLVNNCQTSLDVVTFRGIPRDDLNRFAKKITLVDGTLDEWGKRSDNAIVGETFARRRRLKVGDGFDAAGVSVKVAAIMSSDRAEYNNIAVVHLDFLQQASRKGLGTVTQFNVQVDDPNRLEEIASAIDAEFAHEQEPTQTRPEKAFFAQTAKELVEMVHFTRWVGLGAVLAVLTLIANTILLVVRGRVRDNAVLQTLGYPARTIAALVLTEGVMLGFFGGLIGGVGASLFFHFQSFTMGSEGLTLSLLPDQTILLRGVVLALVLGLFAGIIPAWSAARQPIVRSLRH